MTRSRFYSSKTSRLPSLMLLLLLDTRPSDCLLINLPSYRVQTIHSYSRAFGDVTVIHQLT